MTSHTHAAVDQAICKTVKSHRENSNSAGPLANSDLERDGKIIRVGRVPLDSKVPESVRLDSIMTSKAEGMQLEITGLQQIAVTLSARRTELNEALAKWGELNEFRKLLSVADQNARMLVALVQSWRGKLGQSSQNVAERENLALDQEWQPFDMFTRWFNGPAKRVARAREALAERASSILHLSRLANMFPKFRLRPNIVRMPSVIKLRNN